MKKTLLAIVAVAGFTAASFGQVEISVGTSGDISGTQIDRTSGGEEVVVDVHVENTSGASMDLTIKRERINETAGWTDYICWGHETDPFGGVCYPASTQNPWLAGTAVTLGADEGGTIAVHIKPEGDNGCTVYRYTVMEGTTPIDSLDISVCKSASIKEITPLSISVAPNPANSFVKVKTNGVEGASVKMVDVLGNIVLKETVMGSSKTINTSSFRNGIYFVIVEAEGAKPRTRKVIVRH